MNMNKVNKCIENAKKRIEYKRNHMSVYSYISYFVKRNGMSYEEEAYVREEISRYIDENADKLFNLDFTIKGLAF